MPAGAPDNDPLEGSTRYRTLKYINRGSFGFVLLVEDLATKEQVAIKFVEVA
jgi:serine/threonine protein kinase